MDLTRRGLAHPGAPGMRQGPPGERREIRIWSITSCWPTMTLLSSATIWLRPLVRRSTVCRSNSKADGGGGGGGDGKGGSCNGGGCAGALITGGLFSSAGFVSSTAVVSIKLLNQCVIR